MTISENTYNTILTALKLERMRANAEDNKNNLKCIENALDDIYENAYIESVMD
jgi:hypothetical protein